MTTNAIEVWVKGSGSSIESYEFDFRGITPLNFAGMIESMVLNSFKRELNEYYKVDGSKERYKEYLDTQELNFIGIKFLNPIFNFAKEVFLMRSCPDLELYALVTDINGASHSLVIGVRLNAD